jgi:aminopeptidase N
MKTIAKNFALLLCVILFTNSIPVNDGYPKNPNIDIINYIFKIELSDTTDEISVDLTVDVRFVTKGVKKMRLDLINKSSELGNKGMAVSSVSLNGKSLEYTHKNDELFIHLKEPSKKNQREQIVVNYKGIPANGLKIGDNMHGDRTFFSDNWPNRGRHWLATVDHPSDKAMCEFIVTAPDHYQIVSNGLKIEETNLDNNKRLTHWKQSVPIASWL